MKSKSKSRIKLPQRVSEQEEKQTLEDIVQRALVAYDARKLGNDGSHHYIYAQTFGSWLSGNPYLWSSSVGNAFSFATEQDAQQFIDDHIRFFVGSKAMVQNYALTTTAIPHGVRAGKATVTPLGESLQIIDDLLDGLEGYLSEVGECHRYWRSDIVERASAFLNKHPVYVRRAERPSTGAGKLKLNDYPELCYALRDIEMADPSVTVVSPILIKRGEKGYWPTDWTWKKEHAVEALNATNAKLGVSPQLADAAMARSMFGWPEE